MEVRAYLAKAAKSKFDHDSAFSGQRKKPSINVRALGGGFGI
ncbi:hypothetical protein Pla52n_66170 [Stieleria varia]|uniref:Uncharacterized protein n=1 Tax=Stieleria varia TaxID=2528005 RepID=A0A5C5ZY97_9BACT|nr:hypothetical protein Pla52n_66170 [Stieleria varia]